MMKADRATFERYFLCKDPNQKWVHERIVDLLNSESVVPPFSRVAMKLNGMIRDEKLTMADLGAVISLDPGLTTRCVRVATSVVFGGLQLDLNQEIEIAETELKQLA